MARTLQMSRSMRVAPCLLAVAASTSIAVAQPATVPPASAPADKGSDKAASEAVADHAVTEDKVAVGLAANLPFRWPDADSVGVSGYIAFAKQHAIRMNFATYSHHSSAAGALVSLAAGEDGDEGSYSGRITDLGIGYQHYTRSMFEGCTLELGLLRRELDTRVEDDFASPSIVETAATGYAGRALVGWSWLWSQRVFLATGIGVSVGRFAGTERTAGTTYMPQYTSKDFVRYETTAEGYVRLGLAFGL